MEYITINQEEIQQMDVSQLEQPQLYHGNSWSNVGMITGISDEYTMFKNKMYYFIAGFNFLKTYANNELNDAEVDIQKFALYINSPFFENTMARDCTSLKKCYKMFENYVINNIPIHRFLVLNPYQLTIMEKQHYNQLMQEYKKECTLKNCHSCEYYQIDILDMGVVQNCCHKRSFMTRKIPIYKVVNNCINYKKCDKDITDNCIIPITMQYVDISTTDFKMWDSLDYGIKGKKVRIEEVKKCMFIKYAYDFIKMYCNTELNSDIEINIGNLIKYAYKTKFKFKTEEELYELIENLCLEDKINKFIKYPERDKIKRRNNKFIKAIS